MLKYNREPPDVFGPAASESRTHTETIRESAVEINQDLGASDVNFHLGNGPTGLSTLSNSFSEEGTHVDFRTDSARPITPPFDMDEFLMPGVAEDSEGSNTFDSSPALATKPLPSTESSNVENDLPIFKIMSSLQQQVSSLEVLLANQATKEKADISSLQAQVVQLEQKLFQSSERERQLEATLGVVFDAFQTTGAPQAQPNRALWKLVMSHSSQAISSMTGPEQTDEGQLSSVKALDPPLMSQAMSISTKGKRGFMYPDSAYGSMR